MKPTLLNTALFLLAACGGHIASATSDAVAVTQNNGDAAIITAANAFLAKHPDNLSISIPFPVGFNGQNDTNLIKLGLVRVGDPPVGYPTLPNQKATYLATAYGLRVLGLKSQPIKIDSYLASFAVAQAIDVAGEEDLSPDMYGPNRYRIIFHARLVYTDWASKADRQLLLAEIFKQNASWTHFGFTLDGHHLRPEPFTLALVMHQDPAEGWIAEGAEKPTQ